MRNGILLSLLAGLPAALASHDSPTSRHLERRIQVLPIADCGLSASRYQLYRNPLNGTCVARCPNGYYVSPTKTCTKCSVSFGPAVKTCDANGALSCNVDVTGVQYVLDGRQCVCPSGTTLTAGACISPTSTTTTSSSSSTTSSSTTTTTTSSSATTTTTTTTTTTSSTSTSSAPAATPTVRLVDGWSYQGCWTDLAYNGRVLPNSLTSKTSFTVESCLAACASKGYAICGLEYKGECWGAPGVPRWTQPTGQCNLPCKNDPAAICGGNAALTAYVSETIPWVQPVGNEDLSTYHGYDYQGCYSDLVVNRQRVLPRQHTNTEGRVESCLDYCASKGASYCGLEYYGECWYALASESLSSASQPVDETLCRFGCRGAPYEDCGGSQSLSLWKLGTTPPPPATESFRL